MNHKSLLLVPALLSAFLVAGSPKATAQSFIWNTTVTSGLWNDTANWEGGVVPNEIDAVVFFDNSNSTTVNLNGFTATVGELNFANTITIGSTTNSDDILNLDSTDGQPRIIVAANNAFMYGELTGTNGFRKEGAGRLTFRFNPNDQNYTGNVTLAGGIFGINQNGSLGNNDNDLVFEGTSTLNVEPSAVATNTKSVVLPATRSISIAAGATATINVGEFVATTINGDVSGDGGFAFAGAGTLTFAGTNTYTGTTTVNGPGFGGLFITNRSTNTNVTPPVVTTNVTTNGATRTSLLAFSNSASWPTNSPLLITMGTGSAIFSTSTITVNLGGAAITPSSFSVIANGATAIPANSTNSLMAINITNGSLAYSAPTESFLFNTRGAGAVTAELRLPETTSLTYASMGIASTNGASANALVTSRILIGSNATFNADLVTLATYRTSGSIEGRAAGASLKLRGTDGISPVPQILIGNFAGGPNPTASINLSNGSVDIAATEIVVAKNIANASSATGSLNFGSGSSVTASNLIVGLGGNNGNIVTNFVTNNATTPPTITTNFTTNQVSLNASVTQNGGSSLINTVILGKSGPTTPTNSVTNTVLDRYTSTYNLNGGTLATSVIKSDSTNAAISGMTRTFNHNGGTLRNFDAAQDLSITATTNAFSAIGFVAGTTNGKTIAVDPGRSINFSAGVAAQFNGGTTTFELASNSVANLAGRFQIGVSTTNAATVVVTNGTVNLSSASGILGIGDRTAGSSALNISGGSVNIALAGANRMLVGNKFDGSISVTGGTLTVTGSPEIYVGGDIGFAAANALGTMTVATGGVIDIQSAGALVLGQNQTNGATTGAIGRLNINQGGTFRTARAISAGTNGVSTGEVNFDGGTLAAGADAPSILAVTTANITTNGFTFDTGTFDSGIGQNLAGTGTLTVIGSGTLRLNGTNTPPVVVNSGATLGGTGSAGSVTVNGTIAPGPVETNGIFTATTSLAVTGTARFRLFGNAINDKIVASGGANLSGGTVAVTIDTNYTPANGDSFDLVDGTISGSPALSLPALDGGLTWVTNSFTTSGVLSITSGEAPTNNYASWLANYPTLTGANTNGTADPDGDGFINNLEFAFDGNPTVGTPALMTVTPAGTNAVFNWVERLTGVGYQVQKNSTLTNAWTGPAAVTVSNSANTNGILIPADYVRKEFVIPASGKDFYRVQATITNN